MKKQFLILCFSAAFSIAPSLNAMEELSLNEPRTTEVAKTKNEEQSHFQDDPLITVKLEDDNDQIAFSIDLPYKAIKLSNTLHHNISFDENAENKIITVPVANISGIEMSEFKTTLEILKLFASGKFEKDCLPRTLTKNSILKLLNVANYLDCQKLHEIFTEVLDQKIQKLLFEKNKPQKALSFTESIEHTDHCKFLFNNACTNLTDKEIEFPSKTKKRSQGPVNLVRFSPHGSMFASSREGYRSQVFEIWDTKTWTCIQNLEDCGYIHAMDFSPDGALLVAYTQNERIKIWDTKTWQCLKTLQTSSVSDSLCFSRDGSLLVVSTYIGQIVVYDTITWQCINTIQSSWCINSISLSPDNTKLASTGDTQKDINIWNPITGACIKTLNDDKFKQAFFSHDGTKLAAASIDGTVTIWNTTTWQCLKKFENNYFKDISSMCFSLDDTKIALASQTNKMMIILDTQTGNLLHTLHINQPINDRFAKTRMIFSIDFSPDGSMLAVGSSAPYYLEIFTILNLKKDFTLSTLLFIKYLIHHKKQGTLSQLSSEQLYFDLFLQLPEEFQKEFKHAIDQYNLKAYLKEKTKHKSIMSYKCVIN